MPDIYSEIKNPEKVLFIVREFIDEYGLTSSEAVEQSDRAIDNSPEFIEALCEAAGYAEVEIDEDEDISGFDYDVDNEAYDD